MAPGRLVAAGFGAAGWIVSQAPAAPPSIVGDPWFQVLNFIGWPSLFIFGLKMGWWTMGKCDCPDPGVDASFKEIALRSIENNEELVHELRESRARRRADSR